ncbi:hypothetical protein GOP47_0013334 [Adiantum capillus-veneris]|uniref:Uncharacterized protein n=1 Tax=Adiantum capillus-veneris TaxID=13818 RepID=A0A9D4UNB1_ADICA|nr:hypothetical protein GOP47_0013334 [Adiantum capillus-veneris]
MAAAAGAAVAGGAAAAAVPRTATAGGGQRADTQGSKGRQWQLKTGDVHILGATASALVKEGSLSSEVRHYGLKLLQHLVRMRWEELTVATKAQLADLVLGLVPEIATAHDEWFLKSQTAALVAEVIRHEDVSLWQGLLSKLVELSAVSPAYAELVLMVLRWLPEDITVYNEDLEGDRRRQLVHCLTQALTQIFPFFFKMLESHFVEAVNLLQQGQVELAKQHATVANGTLNALLAYVEWAPVEKIAENGLIEACGFLLNAAEFRLRSCEIMKQIVSRKRPLDESAATFDATIRRIFEVLSQASRALQSAPAATKEDDSEFAEYVAEALVAIGSQHLQCFVGLQEHITAFLQLMLGFFEHRKIGVHYWALLFWLAILREIPSACGHSSENKPIAGKLGVIGSVPKDKKGVVIFLSDEVYASVLHNTFNWYFQNSSKVVGGIGRSLEEISDVKDYGNYRSRLLDLVRLVAVQRPYISVIKISEKVKEACASVEGSTLTLGVLDSVQKLLEAIICAIFGGENVLALTEVSLLQRPLEVLLRTLLMVKWRGSAFVEIHGRLLDAMGPFLKTSPDATLGVLNKIFELLISLPLRSTSFQKDSIVIESSRSRLQVCTSLLRIAKAADKTVSAHLEVIWKTISALQEQGLLQQGEHNLIAEAFLVAGSAAGKECEARAFDCFLSPIQSRWKINHFQERFLSAPGNLLALLTKQTTNSQNDEMWSIFHSIVFTERVVKRCASQYPDVWRGGTAIEPFHPIINHMKWIVMPLLQLLRCIHALWSPKIKHSLPTIVQGALRMSSAEQASVIGEAGTKSAKANASDVETQAENQVDGNENEIRNWLKGVRDSSYSLLGLAATHFRDIFFGHDSDVVQISLLENIEAMEYRHMRLFLHFVVIPLVKSCPEHLREVWLGKILPSSLIFCESALSLSWTNLLKNGAVKLSDGACKSEGLGIKEEVLEEKLLRDLSRETCILLAVFASPSLNPNLPSGEQLLQTRLEPSKPDCFATIGSDSMMSLVIRHHSIAKASLSLCIQALKWSDSEAVHKALIFCGTTVIVAAISGNVDLQNFVATDLFTAIIEALTMDSNSSAQAELINLFRMIYLLMAQQHAAPRQILQSSPAITGEVLLAFENALTTTSSAKEHRQYIKSLLMQAGVGNLKALTAAKTRSSITNVANRPRPTQVAAIESEETGNIGLAAFM